MNLNRTLKRLGDAIFLASILLQPTIFYPLTAPFPAFPSVYRRPRNLTQLYRPMQSNPI